MGEVVQVGDSEFQAAQKVVVDQHRRYRDRDPDTGRDQRCTNGAGHGFKAGGAGSTDAFQGRHDAPHGAEQTDKRRGAADTGQNGQATFQRAAFAHDLLAQGPFEAVLMVDSMAQVSGGRAAFGDLNGVVASLRDAGCSARLGVGQFSGRVQA